MRSKSAVFATMAISASLAAAPPSTAPAGTGERAAGRTSQPVWLDLADYPRPPAPDTGWGLHDNPNCFWRPEAPDAFFREMHQRWGFSWYKLVACGKSKLDMVAAARRQGLEPVVRLYAPKPTPYYPRPGRETEEFVDSVHAYVAAGARYFECGNEPNLTDEWADGEWKKGERIERICRQWLRARRLIAQNGGIPLFYAMAPGSNDGRSAAAWWEDCFVTLRKWGVIDEAFAGAGFATHLCSFNHPLDYPFDTQRALPHATQAERIACLRKDSSCYLAVELLVHLMDEYLPRRIPILSTEGGTFIDNHDDKRYPPVTPERHRDMNIGIFLRMNPRHPEYWGNPLFAQMSWIHHADAPPFSNDGWFKHPRYGDLPVLDALERLERFDRGIAFRPSSRPAGP